MTPEIPTITTLASVPEFARGFVRDLRPRWAFEEVGQPYEVTLITDAKCAAHRRRQPFGQVPTYRDEEVSIFESGAIVQRIAERAGKLIPKDAPLRMQALQWLTAALNCEAPACLAGFRACGPMWRGRGPAAPPKAMADHLAIFDVPSPART